MSRLHPILLTWHRTLVVLSPHQINSLANTPPPFSHPPISQKGGRLVSASNIWYDSSVCRTRVLPETIVITFQTLSPIASSALVVATTFGDEDSETLSYTPLGPASNARDGAAEKINKPLNTTEGKGAKTRDASMMN